jgi:hypothetical protein
MMSIKITGYDIIDCSRGRDENHLVFHGTAHLETQRQAIDVPFSGEHERGMTGFVHFDLEDPDQIDVTSIRQESDVLRDTLAEHVLVHGYSTGEYRENARVHD